MKLKFELTCGACPEQYDVFDESGKLIAYIRLRWNELRVDVPDCGGETIYSTILGDYPMQGSFVDEEQRSNYLSKIESIIIKHYK